MKKILILLVVLAILPLAQAAAQSSGFNVFSCDMGYTPSYDIANGTTASRLLFGFNVMVDDDLSAGFTLVSATVIFDNLSLLTLKYRIVDRIKAQVSLGVLGPGGVNTPVSGLGFEYAPFTRRYGDSLSTELKLRLEYLFLNGDIDNGLIFFGLAFGVGV
jgi:hypothetical protein